MEHQWGQSWRDRPPPAARPPALLCVIATLGHCVIATHGHWQPATFVSVQHRNTMFQVKNYPMIKNVTKWVAVPSF